MVAMYYLGMFISCLYFVTEDRTTEHEQNKQ